MEQSCWKIKLKQRWEAFYLQWQIYSMTYFLEPWEKCLVSALRLCAASSFTSKMFRKIWKSISSVYLLYELNTCIYMLDPWEKRFVNAFIFVILGLLIFSSYTFLPGYTRKLVYAFLPQHSMSDLEFNIH